MNSRFNLKSAFRMVGAICLIALVTGCATGPNANPSDPLEPFNRGIFNFNEGVDRAVLKPVATVYRDITPSPVRTGVTNVFSNIGDVWSLVNNVLQFKPKESFETLMRLSFNTVLGFGGVFDIATEMRLERHKEDFGQTLGYWGVAPGPYVVLPLLGPSTVRDTVGTVVDSEIDPVTHIDHIPTRNSLVVLRGVDTRARLLSAGDVLDQASLDKYTFTREAYMQRRTSLIGRDPAAIEERFDLPEAAPRSASGSNAAPAR